MKQKIIIGMRAYDARCRVFLLNEALLDGDEDQIAALLSFQKGTARLRPL